jgi:hypothetical protein
MVGSSELLEPVSDKTTRRQPQQNKGSVYIRGGDAAPDHTDWAFSLFSNEFADSTVPLFRPDGCSPGFKPVNATLRQKTWS